MKILYRYTFGEALLFFSICLFAFTGILLTLRMLHFASLIVDKGVELGQIGEVFIAIIPTFLEIAIPLATLLGIMLAFGRLSGDSEIVVMRASGISIAGLIWPVLAFGLITGLVGLEVSQDLKPWGFRTLSRTLFEIARSKSTSGLEPGIFNKLGDLTIYSEQIDYQSGALKNVLIDDRRDAPQRKIVVAKSGNIVSDEANRTVVMLLREGTIHEQVEGRYTVTRFTNNRLTVNPDQLFEQESAQGRPANEMTRGELKERLAYLKSLIPLAPAEGKLKPAEYPAPVPASVFPEEISKESLKKHVIRTELELGQRFSLPFASVALALLALPLGIQPPRAQRTWGAGLSATLGLVVFVLYYGFFSVGLVLAQNRTLPPLLALWLPNLLVLTLACFTLRKTSSEKWHSVAAAIHEAVTHAASNMRRLWRPRRSA